MAEYITPDGLEIPTIEGMLADVSQEQKVKIDPVLDTTPESPTGEFNGIFASHLREAWEVLEIAWNFGPLSEGRQLENVAAITGTRRQEATPSRFGGTHRAIVNLDAGATLPIGSVAHVDGKPDVRFDTTEAVTNSGGSPANFNVALESETLGPVVANAGTLTVIATPVVGWNSITNPYDAELGLPEDDDPALRARREEELRATGSGTVDSIRSDLLALTTPDGEKPILEAIVLENTGDVIDAYGIPPHSIEPLVYDGVAAATDHDLIAQVVWDSKGAGIRTVGGLSGDATDALGVVHAVRFSRPVIRNVGFEVEIEVDSLQYDGDDAVKQVLVNTMAAIQKPGAEVKWSKYVAAILSVPGVLSVQAIGIGFVGDSLIVPNTDLIVGVREQTTTTTSFIEIDHV